MTKGQNQYRETAERWRENSRVGGYEYHIKGKGDCAAIGKMPRVWKRLFSLLGTKNKQERRALEVGCGGGKQLVVLAANGWRCVGIDVSPDVLGRAKNYIGEIFTFCKKKLEIKLIFQDFFDYQTSEHFDLVFHFGVLEHFLDDEERLAALRKMFSLTRPGGYVVSVVPNGIHPLRGKMKKLGLGGYFIPEIDYNPTLLRLEFEKCSGKNILVLPHNIFSYFLIKPAPPLLRTFNLVFYYLSQLIPISLYPRRFSFRQAGTLIGIAQK